ncbi:hypothetical protein AMTRI_Chr03g51760 [Amborella trichopoda]
MASLKTVFSLLFLISFSLNDSVTSATKTPASVVRETPLLLTYHNGPLLSGQITLNLLWYGNFTSSQRAIILDYLHSLSHPINAIPSHQNSSLSPPSVSQWWRTIGKYVVPNSQNTQKPAVLRVGKQAIHSSYSLGRFLTRANLSSVVRTLARPGSITLVLTAHDVNPEGFCLGTCGHHSWVRLPSLERAPYIWVGDSSSQCPGLCAWPFHKPAYGPQGPSLVAPNGDVGSDGLVMNIAKLLGGTVTNPLGGGFYEGEEELCMEEVGLCMEAGSACVGVYGKGAYPGYTGEVLVDELSGGSYNAVGMRGRKYLLPALWDPQTHKCETLV